MAATRTGARVTEALPARLRVGLRLPPGGRLRKGQAAGAQWGRSDSRGSAWNPSWTACSRAAVNPQAPRLLCPLRERVSLVLEALSSVWGGSRAQPGRLLWAPKRADTPPPPRQPRPVREAGPGWPVASAAGREGERNQRLLGTPAVSPQTDARGAEAGNLADLSCHTDAAAGLRATRRPVLTGGISGSVGLSLVTVQKRDIHHAYGFGKRVASVTSWDVHDGAYFSLNHAPKAVRPAAWGPAESLPETTTCRHSHDTLSGCTEHTGGPLLQSPERSAMMDFKK